MKKVKDEKQNNYQKIKKKNSGSNSEVF